jgi:hypothetical protein
VPTTPTPGPETTSSASDRSRSWDAFARNLLELALIVTDLAPGWVVSGETYRMVRRALSRTPERYEAPAGRAAPFTAGGWRERKLVSRTTDLCIDAFPGSGNSFVSNSVRGAVDRPVNIESHFHQTAQLKRALALEIPAVVLVRDPKGACTSQMSKHPSLAAPVVLLRWIQYYRWVRRRFDRLTVVLFDDVIRDVDLLRRRSPAVAKLVSGPIEPRLEFQRASKHRREIDETRPVNRMLLVSARAIYDQIEARCRVADRRQRASR